MSNFPKKLKLKIEQRAANYMLRSLKEQSSLIDFSSNDYLGFAKSPSIFTKTHQYLIAENCIQNGATGSRLLSGNHSLYARVETELSVFHQAEAAIIFNAGYAANIGFFAAVPQRGDVIFYDEYIHASIRDGISMSASKSYKFKHNNVADLEEKITRYKKNNKEIAEIYVVTEAVFSMDGDTPDLETLAFICNKMNAHFIVDEAHSVGVFGEKGAGKIVALGLEKAVFARIITFGKALGCHGAAILGSEDLKKYILNFSRSLIYTTALSPHAIASIKIAYETLQSENLSDFSQRKLQENIEFFTAEIARLHLQDYFIKSHSAIHSCIVSGNEKVIVMSNKLAAKGFDVKAIMSPTVSKNDERLRFCLHSYNSKTEMTSVLELLCIFVKENKLDLTK